MIKKILVPIDFSSDSNKALKVAAQLAKKNDATIFLLNILNLPSHYTDQLSNSNSSNAPEALMFMQSIHGKFEKLINSELLKNIDVREIVSSKNIPEGITEKCIENDIDITIVGSHGTSKPTSFFSDSNTEKIVRDSLNPVLVIKENTDIKETKKIVFTSQFTDEEISIANKLNLFAKEIDATIHLLYVNTPKNFKTSKSIEDKMISFTEKCNLENYSLNIYNDKTIESGVLNFSNGINANLICIGTHERKGISQFINNSLSNDLIHHTNKPILTYRLNDTDMIKSEKRAS